MNRDYFNSMNDNNAISNNQINLMENLEQDILRDSANMANNNEKIINNINKSSINNE